MQPNESDIVQEILRAVRSLTPEKRHIFLDARCASDSRLREKVEEILDTEDLAAIECGNALESDDLAGNPGLFAGQKFGRYNIVKQIGAGGMGRVYLATDIELERPVAIKVLARKFADDKSRVERFVLEARAASALDHPNIITVHEIGNIEDQHFIATEFVRGKTLRERMHDPPRPTLAESLEIACQIADALKAAHEAQIVHRDIKPENIMLRHDGYIKVLDFGLAKMSPRRVRSANSEAPTARVFRSEPGQVMGTCCYSSPEQLRGFEVDARTDIWSLGVILYEMVAGRRPFEADTNADVIAAILTDHGPPLLSDDPGVFPERLDGIIRKALQKDRTKRYQTAEEFLAELSDLKSCLSGEDCTFEPRPKNSTIEVPVSSKKEVGNRSLYLWTATIIAVAITVFALVGRWYSTFRSTETNRKAISSVVVLPFVNATGDSDGDYLADGITESLINSLTRIEALKVTARQTAFAFKGKEFDPLQVGRELNVEAALTGQLTRTGELITLQVDLIATPTGTILWSEHYDRKESDLVALKQELARQIVERLTLRLRGEEERQLIKGGTNDPEAFQLYSRGLYYSRARNADDIEKAIEFLQRAVQKDPRFALAYVELTDLYIRREPDAGVPAFKTLPLARDAVEHALAIDDTLAEAHIGLALLELRSWNFSRSESEFRRAIELNPNNANGLVRYAHFLRLAAGKPDQAMSYLLRARELDPKSERLEAELIRVYLDKDDLESAKNQAFQHLAIDPTNPSPYFMLSVVYRKQGLYEQAISEIEKGLALNTRQGGGFLAQLAVCHAVAGHRSKARNILNQLLREHRQENAFGRNIAVVYAALGDKNRAFYWLEKDFQAHSGVLPGIATDPWADVMRQTLSSDPRWNSLLRRIGLPIALQRSRSPGLILSNAD